MVFSTSIISFREIATPFYLHCNMPEFANPLGTDIRGCMLAVINTHNKNIITYAAILEEADEDIKIQSVMRATYTNAKTTYLFRGMMKLTLKMNDNCFKL